MSDYSYTGTCRCSKCDSINPFRAGFLHKVGDVVWPGFLGDCRICGKRGFQQILRLTTTLEEAVELSTLEANETRTATST
jgi:hypothetical protein